MFYSVSTYLSVMIFIGRRKGGACNEFVLVFFGDRMWGVAVLSHYPFDSKRKTRISPESHASPSGKHRSNAGESPKHQPLTGTMPARMGSLGHTAHRSTHTHVPDRSPCQETV